MRATQVMALAPEGTLSFGRSILDSLGVSEGQAALRSSARWRPMTMRSAAAWAVEPDAGADGPRADARPLGYRTESAIPAKTQRNCSWLRVGRDRIPFAKVFGRSYVLLSGQFNITQTRVSAVSRTPLISPR
jgi:hypothetical protein